MVCTDEPEDLMAAAWRALLVGQDQAIDTILPYVQMHQAALSPPGRPAGVFMLLGPTGTGKTRTVETLARVLHGSENMMLRIDCGEFQMEHEVAKLSGAPPGYLGHRETIPILTQMKLAAITTETCSLSIVLFDEVEKAAPALARLLLGIFDKSSLKLGDNTNVNFDNTLIFMTSNLGARRMAETAEAKFGLAMYHASHASKDSSQAQNAAIGKAAIKRNFSPEFVNRLDETVTFKPLDRGNFEAILDLLLADFNGLLLHRLPSTSPRVTVTTRARDALLDQGVSAQYGGRNLKRTMQRNLLQPLAQKILRREIQPGAAVVLDTRVDGSFHFLVRA